MKRRETRQKWVEANRERVRESGRARYRRHKEKFKAKTAAWFAKNPDRRRQYYRKWDAEHPEIKRANCATRKARKIKATPAWANLEAIKEKNAEARRLEQETGVLHHVDHIVPLRNPFVCGLHWEGNLQVLHAVDNYAKSNKLLEAAY